MKGNGGSFRIEKDSMGEVKVPKGAISEPTPSEPHRTSPPQGDGGTELGLGYGLGSMNWIR